MKQFTLQEIPFDGRIMKCTTSIGVAVADNSSTPLNTLIKQADAALYQAKASGRNQVIMA